MEPSSRGTIASVLVLLIAVLLRGILLSSRALEGIGLGIDRAGNSAAEQHSLLVFHLRRHRLEVEVGLEATKVAEDAVYSHREQIAARLVDHVLKLYGCTLKPLEEFVE